MLLLKEYSEILEFDNIARNKWPSSIATEKLEA